MTVTVEAGGRLHFGFGNLSLAHERLYGAMGAAIAEPAIRLRVSRASDVACDHGPAREYATRAVELLDVDGASVTVEESLPRHAGLGSGTQLALAVLAGVAHAHGREPRPRERAPQLGRGGRSGVGVATFERGGFVVDAGHPTAQFTPDRPPDGAWTVPRVVARRDLPDDWRFLVVLPDLAPGRSGGGEDEIMRRVVEAAEPEVADRIAGVITRQLLPAVADGSVERFGTAIAAIGRLNGTWYSEVQGGIYRPPIGAIVDSLSGAAAIHGAGQSSWGPAVYGVTDADGAERARSAGHEALAAGDVDGEVLVTRPRNIGAGIED